MSISLKLALNFKRIRPSHWSINKPITANNPKELACCYFEDILYAHTVWRRSRKVTCNTGNDEMPQRRCVRWDKIQLLYTTYNRLIKMLPELALWSLEQRRHDANARVIIIYLNVYSLIAVPIYVPLCLLTSAGILCKKFGPRSVPTKCRD